MFGDMNTPSLRGRCPKREILWEQQGGWVPVLTLRQGAAQRGAIPPVRVSVMLTSAEGQNALFVISNYHTGVQIKLRGISWHCRGGSTSMIKPLSQLWPHSPIHAWVLHVGSFYCHVQG